MAHSLAEEVWGVGKSRYQKSGHGGAIKKAKKSKQSKQDEQNFSLKIMNVMIDATDA